MTKPIHWYGTNPTDFPVGISRVPFVWDYLGTEYRMEFLGGFVGTAQSDSLVVKNSLGWAVREQA